MTDEHVVSIDNVHKRFGDVLAIDGVSLNIERGGFFALLGGSGCGKTTLLRMLAGFEAPDEGRLFIDGRDMANVPPHARPANMMFQSYALFPHMTIADNVGYGLKHDRLDPTRITARVDELLDLVQLAGLGKRRPHQLSGGQRQRVALARAIARQPVLLLLDEPLGALDKTLRERTQFEMKAIQQRTGITFIVVTHDQEEAMTLADRVAVMDRGRIRQVGSPSEIYEHPADRFVAEFIGSITMFDARLVAPGQAEIPEMATKLACRAAPFAAPSDAVTIAIRPEKLLLHPSAEQAGCGNVIAGHIAETSYAGTHTLVRVRLGGGAMIAIRHANSGTIDIAGWAPGARVWLSVAPDAVIVLPR